MASTQHYASHHSRYTSYTQPPQPPPSPPMEESKCSLPSISNLLGLADAGSPTSECSPTSFGPSQRLEDLVQRRHETYSKPESRRSSEPSGRPQPRIMPPSPPMSTDASFDNCSPTSKSVSQFSNASAPSGYYHETTPPLEADHQRYQPAPRASAPAPYTQQPLPPASYINQPPMGTYYQPSHPPPAQAASLHYQRPLPQAFPPLNIPVALAHSSSAAAAAAWQHHHHYMNPSHGGPFPQSQDRYICQTCNKAFSRPSSLRIHSHSHTGEKPFKCPHAGCGKAFSVRSNMKRHERGCHSFEVSAGGSALSS